MWVYEQLFSHPYKFAAIVNVYVHAGFWGADGFFNNMCLRPVVVEKSIAQTISYQHDQADKKCRKGA